eukprot:874357-Pyramimonas_sp.AAC.1
MFTTLTAIGLSEGAMNMNLLKALYGVRQGCPLSSLLRATVAEVLVVRVEADCPDSVVRACVADAAL